MPRRRGAGALAMGVILPALACATRQSRKQSSVLMVVDPKWLFGSVFGAFGCRPNAMGNKM